MNVTALIAISSDGFIATSGDASSLEWTSLEDKKFFAKKTKELGTMVMGRKTWETIGKPLMGRKIIVITSHPERWLNIKGMVEFTNEQPVDLVARLDEEGEVEDLVVAGGAKLYGQFFHQGLVNDVYLTREAAVLGAGVPLELDEDKWNLVDTKVLSEATSVLHYKVK
jgi:dihydrofolate reductase